jgi:hypothetical protein
MSISICTDPLHAAPAKHIHNGAVEIFLRMRLLDLILLLKKHALGLLSESFKSLHVNYSVGEGVVTVVGELTPGFAHQLRGMQHSIPHKALLQGLQRASQSEEDDHLLKQVAQRF